MTPRRGAIPGRSWAFAGSAVATAALLAVGCGRDEQPAEPPVASAVAPAPPDEVLTVEQASKYRDGQQLTVRGALVIEGGRSRLCHVLLESYPPQCGQVSLQVEGLDRDRLTLEEVRGVAWKPDVTLSGTVADGVLRVSDIVTSTSRGNRAVGPDTSGKRTAGPSIAMERPSEPRPCPLRFGDDEPPQFDARTLLGSREADARAAAERFGCELRVTRRDGRGLDITGDLRADRIDVELRDGFVVALTDEGWTSYAPMPRK